jgi:hypothetical protein
MLISLTKHSAACSEIPSLQIEIQLADLMIYVKNFDVSQLQRYLAGIPTIIVGYPRVISSSTHRRDHPWVSDDDLLWTTIKLSYE